MLFCEKIHIRWLWEPAHYTDGMEETSLNRSLDNSPEFVLPSACARPAAPIA